MHKLGDEEKSFSSLMWRNIRKINFIGEMHPRRTCVDWDFFEQGGEELHKWGLLSHIECPLGLHVV